VVVVVTAILDKILGMVGIGLEPGFAPWLYTAWMLMANVLIGWGTIAILQRLEPRRRRQRQEFEPRPLAVAPKSEES
jgi:hypothetical protein